MIAKLAAALLTAASLAALASEAAAEPGAWKVGNSYVVRFEQLDLAQPQARQHLLRQIERSANKLCAAQSTRARKEACATSAIKATLDQSPAEVRSAVTLARLERDGTAQANR